jgi:hypothetical protein
VRTSIFAFASDLDDEGLETVLDNVERRGRIGGVTLAVAYHDGRDIFPHNPRQKVGFLESGAIFFQPDPEVWRQLRIQPRISELATDRDPLADLQEASAARGLDTHAWAVFLHNDFIAQRNTSCTPCNVYGDRDLSGLCPAHPAVRAYAVALARDLGSRQVSSIVAESLHYGLLEHGHAHERYPTDLGPAGRFLLGLCFCSECCAVARAAGVDVDSVRRHVRQELDRVFAKEPARTRGELSRRSVEKLAGGELARFLDARAQVVTSLVAEVRVAAAPTPLVFMDVSGALRGHATGRPKGPPVASSAWKFGVDLDDAGGAFESVCALGYASDPRRLRTDLEDYRRRLRRGATLSLALRPSHPDCDSAENMAEKLRHAATLEVDVVHFYHYGLVRLTALDTIARAISRAL